MNYFQGRLLYTLTLLEVLIHYWNLAEVFICHWVWCLTPSCLWMLHKLSKKQKRRWRQKVKSVYFKSNLISIQMEQCPLDLSFLGYERIFDKPFFTSVILLYMLVPHNLLMINEWLYVALTSEEQFLNPRWWSNQQPPDKRWDGLSIELPRLRWWAEMLVQHVCLLHNSQYMLIYLISLSRCHGCHAGSTCWIAP